MMKKMRIPDVGVNFTHNKLFVAMISKDNLSAFNIFGFWKLSNDVKFACSYNHGGKTTGNFSLGLAYSALKDTTLKAKVTTQGQCISCGAKHVLAKGFTLTSGLSYNVEKRDFSYGLKI